MPAVKDVASTIAQELHSLLFFEEFTFARNQFSPPEGSELELADAVVMLGETLLIYQIKERSLNDAGDADAERKWFESAVRKKGLRQVKDTLRYLQSYAEINVPNERGRVFNLASKQFGEILKLVVYQPSPNLPDECRTIRCHISKTAGFIHIVTAEDYLQIAQTLRVPAEMTEYFKYRETILKAHPDKHAILHDAIMAGHFIGGDHNTMPTEASVRFVHQLLDDSEQWDLSRFLRGIHSHLIPDYTDDYYEILVEYAKLPRSMWRAAKERLVLCLKKAGKAEATSPYRLSYPATGAGFVFISVPSFISEQPEWQENKLRGLTNYTEAHKYDQKLDKCVGVSISRDGEDFDIFWCYISHPWENNPEMQAALDQDFPFRAVKEAMLNGYRFDQTEEP